MHKFWNDFSARIRCLWITSAVWLIFLPAQAEARSQAATQCDAAAIRAAQETGVPLDVLRTITRIETGRTRAKQFQPWPWTVNMQGHGIWFDTEAQAQVYVFRHFKQGARSFDIGCFQINYKWHGHAFTSIEDMFDPLVNARYAASFLRKLYREHGDWNKAVGAYHSRTHKHAKRYLKRYKHLRRNLPTVPKETARVPLVLGRSAEQRGSLVPDSADSRASLFTNGRGG